MATEKHHTHWWDWVALLLCMMCASTVRRLNLSQRINEMLNKIFKDTKG